MVCTLRDGRMLKQFPESKPLLLIRANATPDIGAGHVARCYALAEAWAATGGVSEVVGSIEFDWLSTMLSDCGVEHMDPGLEPGGSEDLAFLNRRIRERAPSWTILDGYAFDDAFRSGVDGAAKLGVVDDLADQPSYAGIEIIVNHGIHANDLDYPSTDPECKLLIGPNWALLRNEFWGPRSPSSRGLGRRVLVTLGGADRPDEMQKLTDAIELRGLEVVRTTSGRSLGNAARTADVAVCAAGTTCLEIMSLGIPSVVVAIADNQIPVATALAAGGYVVWVEDASDETSVADQVLGLFEDPRRREVLTRSGMSLVDGAGALRVVQTMRGDSFWLRQATSRDGRIRFDIMDDTNRVQGRIAARIDEVGAILVEEPHMAADKNGFGSNVEELVTGRVELLKRLRPELIDQLTESGI